LTNEALVSSVKVKLKLGYGQTRLIEEAPNKRCPFTAISENGNTESNRLEEMKGDGEGQGRSEP